MPKPVAEQVVVITGASSGIGRCTAQHLAANGARVVVTARRADALEQLVREIAQQGGQALAVPGDVTRQQDLRAVADATVQHFGRIDTWINNASIYIQGRVQDITLDWRLSFPYSSFTISNRGSLARKLIPLSSLARSMGAMFGVALWAVSLEGWMPALGVMEAPTEKSPEKVPMPVRAHILYGATTALACEALENL